MSRALQKRHRRRTAHSRLSHERRVLRVAGFVAPAPPSFGAQIAPALWWTAVASLFATQYIHWGVIDLHAEDWALAGVFFFALSAGEGGLGVALVLAKSRRWALIAVTLSLGTVAVWAVDRTVGLPFGPDAGGRGPVGRADVVASFLELLTAAVLLPFILQRQGRPVLDVPFGTSPGAEPARRKGVVVIGALAVVYVLGLFVFALGDLANDEDVGERAGADHTAGTAVPTSVAAPASATPTAGEPPTELILGASNLAFDRPDLSLPAGRRATIRFDNRDSAPHNVGVFAAAGKDVIFRGEVINGGKQAIYALEPLAPGTYTFFCEVHPAMIGRLRAA